MTEGDSDDSETDAFQFSSSSHMNSSLDQSSSNMWSSSNALLSDALVPSSMGGLMTGLMKQSQLEDLALQTLDRPANIPRRRKKLNVDDVTPTLKANRRLMGGKIPGKKDENYPDNLDSSNGSIGDINLSQQSVDATTKTAKKKKASAAKSRKDSSGLTPAIDHIHLTANSKTPLVKNAHSLFSYTPSDEFLLSNNGMMDLSMTPFCDALGEFNFDHQKFSPDISFSPGIFKSPHTMPSGSKLRRKEQLSSVKKSLSSLEYSHPQSPHLRSSLSGLHHHLDAKSSSSSSNLEMPPPAPRNTNKKSDDMEEDTEISRIENSEDYENSPDSMVGNGIGDFSMIQSNNSTPNVFDRSLSALISPMQSMHHDHSTFTPYLSMLEQGMDSAKKFGLDSDSKLNTSMKRKYSYGASPNHDLSQIDQSFDQSNIENMDMLASNIGTPARSRLSISGATDIENSFASVHGSADKKTPSFGKRQKVMMASDLSEMKSPARLTMTSHSNKVKMKLMLTFSSIVSSTHQMFTFY